MDTKPKPEGVSDDDWAKKKKSLSGLAHFWSGSTSFNQKKYTPADKELRAAIPLVEGNDQLKAATLFYARPVQLQHEEPSRRAEIQPAVRRHQESISGQGSGECRVLRSQGVHRPAAAQKEKMNILVPNLWLHFAEVSDSGDAGGSWRWPRDGWSGFATIARRLRRIQTGSVRDRRSGVQGCARRTAVSRNLPASTTA